MKIVYKHYNLGPDSFHGPDHWLRVGEIGLALAEKTGANKNIVRYFAQLHDIGRDSEDADIFHGIQSAHFCRAHRDLVELSDEEFDTLIFAIAKHPMGSTSDDITIGSCWDADRLDLARVGIYTELKYLSTEQAKEKKFFDWATGLHNLQALKPKSE
jgi:uncharacterized protein